MNSQITHYADYIIRLANLRDSEELAFCSRNLPRFVADHLYPRKYEELPQAWVLQDVRLDCLLVGSAIVALAEPTSGLIPSPINNGKPVPALYKLFLEPSSENCSRALVKACAEHMQSLGHTNLLLVLPVNQQHNISWMEYSHSLSIQVLGKCDILYSTINNILSKEDDNEDIYS